jgi:hypothetical protein
LNLNQRIEGLTQAPPPEVEVVETVASNEDFQTGLSISESLPRAHPDLNGIACMSATGGPTLAQVIRAPEFEEEILGMSHRVLVMREGRFVAEFPREDATEERIMAAATGQAALIA